MTKDYVDPNVELDIEDRISRAEDRVPCTEEDLLWLSTALGVEPDPPKYRPIEGLDSGPPVLQDEPLWERLVTWWLILRFKVLGI